MLNDKTKLDLRLIVASLLIVHSIAKHGLVLSKIIVKKSGKSVFSFN